MLGRILAPMILLATLPSSALAGSGKLETIGEFTDPKASDALRSTLDPKGHRVILGDGNVLCEIWWRNGVPTQPKQDLPGTAYTEIAVSTLLGVVFFPKASADYRGQTIKPGAYTLRYELLPNDGNHLGAAPNRDFLLLIPVDADKDPNARLKFEEMVNLSRKTSATNHPSPLSLIPAGNQKDFPALIENDHGHLVLLSKVKTAAGTDLSLALMVKGQAEQ